MAVNLTTSYTLIFGHFGKRREEFGVAQSFRLDWGIMGRLPRFGCPAGVEFVLSFGAFTALILIFQSRGLIAATASTITFNWDMVAFVPLIGIEIAVTSLVGRYKGAGLPDTAHRSTMSGMRVGLVYSSIMLVLFATCPGALIGVFRPDTNDAAFYHALPLTTFMVRFIAIYVLSNSINVCYRGALRGGGDTFWVMCIIVGSNWFMLATLVVIFNALHASPQVAWLAMIAGIWLLTLALHPRYRSGHWRTIKVLGDPVAAA